MTLRVEVHGKKLASLVPAWRTLGPSWATLPPALAPHIADAEPFVLTAWRGETLAGVWALQLRRSGPVRVLVRLGRELQPYDGVDATDDDVAATLLHWLLEARVADVLQLAALPEHSPLAEMAPIRAVRRLGEPAHWLDTRALDDPEDVLRRLSKTRRKSARRCVRALEARGPVTLHAPPPGPARRAAIDTALTLKQAWLDSQQLRNPALSAPWLQRSLLAAGDAPELAEGLQVHQLRVDGELAATEVGWLCAGHYQSYLGAFAPAYAREGAGLVLTLRTMQQCVGARASRYDLLPPPTEFKAGWTDHQSATWRATLPLSRRGRLLAPLLRDGRGQAKRLYHRLPGEVRNTLNGLAEQLQR